ncbi:MAG TPA: Rpn family recombination-promoting nuclease/putative transposase [Pseudoduganella sp.]
MQSAPLAGAYFLALRQSIVLRNFYNDAMPFRHDPAFKLVFSYPELVKSLLELIPECPAKSATGFERLNCSFTSSSERQRNSDMVWRVYCQESFFYLLLEFQSTVDRQMTQRMRVYSGLLSQDLYAQHKNTEPLNLLPVVVYSGARKWRSTNAAVLKWLKPLQEGKVYVLIDEESAGGSIIGDVIRLVRADTLSDVVRSQNALLAWPMASEGLRQEVIKVASERMTFFGANREAIMNEDVHVADRKEFTEEEHALIREYILGVYNAAKEIPEFKRIVEARLEAKREGALEGRLEGREEGRTEAFRAMLSKACDQRVISERLVRRIANADIGQLESWLDGLVAGENLEKLLGEGGP